MAIRNLEFRLSGRDAGAGRAIDDVGRRADGLGSKLKGLGAGLAGGVLGAGLASAFADGVAGMKAAQEVSAQTTTVLKSMGPVAGRTQEQIEGMADSIEKMSGLEAENIQAGQNMLLTFDNIKGTNFDRATMAMADMSARMGGDAVGAATMLGKALQDPAKGMSALTRVGVSFSDQQKTQIKQMQEAGDSAGAQEVMLKALEAQFGGSAKAAGQTLGGQMKILQARLGDVTEGLISQLLPAITKAVEWLGKMVTFVQKNQGVIVPLVAVLGSMAAAVVAVNLATSAGAAIRTAYIALTVGQTAATTAAAGAQTGLNVALLANPIGLVVVALVGLVAGLVVAYQKSDTFREIVTGAFGAVRDSIGWVIEKGVALVTFFTELPGKMAGLGKDMFGFIRTAFTGAINFIIDAWNALEFTLPKVDLGPLGSFGGQTIGVPDIDRIGGPAGGGRPAVGGPLNLHMDGQTLVTVASRLQQGNQSRGFVPATP